MYAVEFETDIKSEYIKVPEYNKLKNKHAKILFLLNDTTFDVAENKTKSEKERTIKLLNKFYAQPVIIDSFVMPTREERNER